MSLKRANFSFATRIHRQCAWKAEEVSERIGMALEAAIEAAEVRSFKGIMRG
jgi:hypothetical protein